MADEKMEPVKVADDWTLVKARPARANAGRKMQMVMQDEQEDEFYKELYGGFAEEANDEQYTTEDEEEDEVDSDFDIDENEAAGSGNEGVEGAAAGDEGDKVCSCVCVSIVFSVFWGFIMCNVCACVITSACTCCIAARDFGMRDEALTSR
eukprot:Opistho-2@34665